jgi:hypothetical protein
MALRVQDQSDQVKGMACEWPLTEALMAGTRAMRDAGVKFLPKWPNEEAKSYDARLATATLYPAFKRTVGVMVGKPFSKAMTFGDDVPEKIRVLCENVDQEGRNLHTFGADVSREAMADGISGVLVDYPTTNGMLRTRAQEQAAGVRPYFVHIRHNQVLGWRSETVDGKTQLSQLRLAEAAEVPDGDFGMKVVKRVRVLTPGAWEIFEENEKGDYTSVASGTTTLKVIPFVPFYGERKAFMVGGSPLIDLAYLNVKHWQSQSDQDTILHVARVPILAVKGVGDTFALTVGASAAVNLGSGENADMKYVEHTGAAIEAGKVSLDDLEQQMIQTGAELLVAKPGQRSATEASNDAEGNKSDLQRISEGWEDSFDQCLQLMAMWVGETEGGHVSLFKDYSAATLSDASAQLVLAMQQGGAITKKTLLQEQQRRGVLSPDIDVDEELEAVEAEGPSLGVMGDPLADPTKKAPPAAE